MGGNTLDMTKGSAWKLIVQFAVPVFLSQVFQQLYNTADALIVGRFLGDEALAAVSASGPLIFLLISFFTGLSMGAGVTISRYFGAGDYDRVSKAIHTDVMLGLISGVILTVVGVWLTPTFLRWMGTAPEVLPDAIAYFRYYFIGVLAVVMYIMMKFAKLNGFDNYKDTYRALYPKPWMEVFFEIFYIIIILAAVASCVDGAGGIVKSLVDLPDIICNLVIIALLILLSIFGVDLIIKASTVLSTAILIVTAILVIMGFVVPIDAVAQELATENAAYASIPAIADVTSQKGLEGVWRGVFVYAAFQCVSVPAMIAASTELTHKGVKRASILGWLMNGGALAASGAMLLRWYPILCTIKSVGVDSVASIAARHIADVMKLPNQSVVTLMGSGYTWLFVVYTILLFCAFVSTSVTLVYSMIQRFEGHCFPKAIKSKAVRSVIVGLVVIGLCYAVSLLGLSTIISKIYGYDGYYALIVVVLPAFIWGIPKIKKLSADKKAELSE